MGFPFPFPPNNTSSSGAGPEKIPLFSPRSPLPSLFYSIRFLGDQSKFGHSSGVSFTFYFTPAPYVMSPLDESPSDSPSKVWLVSNSSFFALSVFL